MGEQNCRHSGFLCELRMNYVEDTDSFLADIKITCAECRQPFHFMGLPRGLNMNGAACSVDGTEGRFAMAPGELSMEAFGKAAFLLATPKQSGH
jgi:hypothetical protein